MLLPVTPPTLRPRQQLLVSAAQDAFRAGHRAVLIQAPTGFGKTVLFSHVARLAADSGKRVLIVAHRRELIRQASNKLVDAGMPHGIIAPDHPETDDAVQVGSVQTLARRLDRLPAFDLIILDECHHAVAGQWADLLEAQPSAFILGLTATPERLDGRGLGRDAGGCFDILIPGPQIPEIITDGYLVSSRVYAPAVALDLSNVRTQGGDFDAGSAADAVDTPTITGDAIEHARRFAPDRATIAFCTTVRHAENVARAARAAGIRAVCAHGGMRQDERDAAITGLATGSVQILTCCDLISEGLDIPNVGVIILLRPTQSLGLFTQQIGRGLRPVYAPGFDLDMVDGRLAAIAASNKPTLIILDHVGNVHRHGLPDTPRQWSLDSRKRKDRGDAVPAMERCPQCYAVQRPAKSCVSCGFLFPVAVENDAGGEREIKQVDGTLQELSSERMQQLREAALSSLLRPGMTYAEIDEIRLARGYKRGWSYYKFRELGAHRNNGASA